MGSVTRGLLDICLSQDTLVLNAVGAGFDCAIVSSESSNPLPGSRSQTSP